MTLTSHGRGGAGHRAQNDKGHVTQADRLLPNVSSASLRDDRGRRQANGTRRECSQIPRRHIPIRESESHHPDASPNRGQEAEAEADPQPSPRPIVFVAPVTRRRRARLAVVAMNSHSPVHFPHADRALHRPVNVARPRRYQHLLAEDNCRRTSRADPGSPGSASS